MSALRVGQVGIPIRIEVGSSDLLPDCSLVTVARFRVFRGVAPQAPETWTDVSVVTSGAAAYVATHATTTSDVAQRDTLRIYVDSSVDGETFIPSESPVIVPVIEN